jgi:hypothetical protein
MYFGQFGKLQKYRKLFGYVCLEFCDIFSHFYACQFSLPLRYAMYAGLPDGIFSNQKSQFG